jgi:hypothetical protein
MINFKTFMELCEQEEEDKDILRTLGNIPRSHAGLVKGYTFKFQGGNTLKGDDDHIGYVQEDPKEIVVAAPWRHSREHVLLHELAHRVWEKLPANLKNKWSFILNKTNKKIPESAEEMFCHVYANFYSNNKVIRYSDDGWNAFIASLPK